MFKLLNNVVQFQEILKPNYNSVDLSEVELVYNQRLDFTFYPLFSFCILKIQGCGEANLDKTLKNIENSKNVITKYFTRKMRIVALGRVNVKSSLYFYILTK